MPRVLSIDVDDVGWDLLNDHAASVPNIRAMQQRGTTFTNYHAGPWCSRDRASRETGKHAFRDGHLVGSVIDAGDTYSIPTSSGTLLAQMVPGTKSHRGKWHLGDWTNLAHRGQCGYDAWSGSPGNLADFYDWWKDDNGTLVHTTKYATLDTTEDAIEDLDAGYDLVRVSYNCDHFPLHVPPPDLAPSFGAPWTNKKKALAALEALDTCLGRLLSEARRRGYLIFLFSDNGTEVSLGGGKGTLYQDGVNVPLIAEGGHYPVAAEGVSLIQATDIHAQILYEFGLPPVEDGLPFGMRDYVQIDAWLGAGSPPDPSAHDWMIRDQRWKLIRKGDGSDYLYRLPDEIHNHELQYPQVVARLAAQIPT